MMDSGNRLIKHSGQVFTPAFLVREILDFSSYCGGQILQKHVIDNSCGDGAFLCEVADRYCRQYILANNCIAGLKEDLEQFIHGIELDREAFGNCIYNLNATASNYGVGKVNWDVLNENALNVSKYNDRMDYVVGNPPYVRVHNLEDDYYDVKTFSFAQDGMTDLYLVFYELGFRMLNKNGKLCYITPSSWLSSVAALNMRTYIMGRKNLVGLIDLGHFQAFENATTYTMIALFDMSGKNEHIAYYSYCPDKKERVFIDNISYNDIVIGDCFYLGPSNKLSLLRKIKTRHKKSVCTVKNGFATLADKVFILDVRFDKLTIPILKASTGKWGRGFFPYDEDGKPLSYEEIFSHPEIAAYLNGSKNDLLKGRDEKANPTWYLYGRTQALKDVFVDKYAINTVIKDVSSIKLTRVPSGAGLYSGLYILTNSPFEEIESVVKSEDFIDYLRILKKYKSGGYYTFNSKDLEQYINARLT